MPNVEQMSSKTINLPANDETAPPIPPRKSTLLQQNAASGAMSSTVINDINRPQKNQSANTTPSISQSNSIEKSENHLNVIANEPPPPQPSLPQQNIKTIAATNVMQPSQKPPTPPQQKHKKQQQDDTDEDEDSNPICGPAETISGIIDTRPVEQRTNYISFASLTNNLTTNFNLTTINDTSSSSSSTSIALATASNNTPTNVSTKEFSQQQQQQKDDNIKASNTYLLKSNHLNNNSNFISNINGTNNHHQRHMSVPVGSATGTPIKTLPTSSSTFQASISQKMANNATSSPLKVASASSSCATTHISNLQLYENVKMKSAGNLITLNSLNNNNASNNSSCNNVSYENINLEYINRLMKEGYSKENVMAALCISRNNFEMACDILHEFVSTNHQQKVYESNR